MVVSKFSKASKIRSVPDWWFALVSSQLPPAWENFDTTNKINYIINLQGDLPQINRECLIAVVNLLTEEAVDIGTLACEMIDPDEINSNSIVKAIADINSTTQIGQAINFTRNA